MVSISPSRSFSSTPPAGQGNPYHAEDYLARKRARDRKSQRAMRDRTQGRIKELEAQVAYFVDRSATMESQLSTANAENANLKAENQSLSRELESLRFGVTPDLCIDNAVDLLSIANARTLLQKDEPQLISLAPPVNVWEQVPWNTPPTCVSDGILYGYIATQRSKLMNETSPLFPDDEPDLSSLLLPAIASQPKSLSTVIADIVLRYKEVNTLPMKVGVQFLMFKILNWLTFRTQETYNQMPTWLRPVPLQFQVQHAAWIDRVPWPDVRIYLIKNPHITFAEYMSGQESTFDISWPYDHSHAVNIIKSVISINPVFTVHLGQLSNWEAGKEVRRKYPAVAQIVDKARAAKG